MKASELPPMCFSCATKDEPLVMRDDRTFCKECAPQCESCGAVQNLMFDMDDGEECKCIKCLKEQGYIMGHDNVWYAI